MYEIELKAHAADSGAVRKVLGTFAKPLEVIDKDDTYYRLDLGGRSAPDGRPYLTCRVRRMKQGGVQSILFTYKRKRLVHDGGGAAIEVNDEKECTLDNAEALEAMLLDAGFTVSHRKHKRAEGYMCGTECGEAHIELCAVPPLGDFLEIEIMSETQDEQTVECAHKAIKGIFAKCGIPLDAIEERYYTQMLEDSC